MSFLRPSADVSDGNWTTDLDGTDLAGAIDETTASDTDYIRSGVNPSGDVCRLAFSDPTGSVDTASAVTVRYRYAKSGSAQVNITARLKEGSTTIASWLHEDVAASWVTAAQTLSGPEKASVSDWSALEIEFEASGIVDQLGGGTITAAASLTGGAIGQVHGIGGAAIVAGATLSGGDVGQSHKIAGATIASASALSGGGIGQDHKLAGATLTAASSLSGGGIAESGGGVTTRRALVSTSANAATGMHSASTIAFAGSSATLAFGLKHTTSSSTNDSNTIWATGTGATQVYNGASTSLTRIYARMDGSTGTPSVDTHTVGVWYHVVIHFGLNHDSTTDIRIYVNGAEYVTLTSSGSPTELASATTHYLMGDDAPGGVSDDGWIGKIYDFCAFDGIVAVSDTQWGADGTGQELTSTALAALLYRIDGQNTGNPGADSSGNGHNFTVENSGITLDDADLPSWAVNP